MATIAHRLSRSLAVVTAATLGASVFAPVSPAGAHTRPRDPGTTIVAQGLDNPRQLSFGPDGSLYIAESGRGGAGPCFDGPEGRACLGMSGAVTRVRHGVQTRVVTGLPSLAGESGGQATGPSDVVITHGQHYAVSIGLGGTPSTREALGADATLLGTIVSGSLRHGTPRVVADMAAHEAAHDPDGQGVDSNAVSLAVDDHRRGDRGLLAVDAGGNDVLRVSRRAGLSTAAVLPRLSTTNPFSGQPMLTQSVPTSAVRGPDGAIYVSELTGFPFPKGAARIWRIGSDGTATVWASGLTNVTDLAWQGGSLYAVQLSDEGLLSGSTAGSLVRLPRGSSAPKVVTANLVSPYGLAIRRGSAYVTVCSVCAGGGQVVRIPLR